MANSDPKLFLLSGFLPEDEVVKEDLETKIRALGGEVLDDEIWHEKCTHVISKDIAKISEKVMAGLAAGRWIVTKRYVEKSHRNGAWENPRPYVAHQVVLFHKKNWAERGREGGCCHNMTAVLLLEEELKCQVYARVIRAGSGVVLDKVDINMMAEGKIHPSSVTHVFLDPGVIHEGHSQHEQFIKWKNLCKESRGKQGKAPWHLHYKYLVYLVRRPVMNLSEKNYDIYDEKIQAMYRAEILQRGKQPGKRINAPHTNGVSNKKQKMYDVQEVIALDDSDDDDIQVLEQRMEKEAEERRLEGGSRRYVRRNKTRGQTYKKSLLGQVNEVVELDDSDSDDDDVVTLDSDEEMDNNDKGKSMYKKRSISPQRGDREGEMEVDQDERVDSEDEDRDVIDVEEDVKETGEVAPLIFDISDDEGDRRSSVDSDIVDISPTDNKVNSSIVEILTPDNKVEILSSADKCLDNRSHKTIASEIESFAKQMVDSQENANSTKEPDSDIVPSISSAVPSISSIVTAVPSISSNSTAVPSISSIVTAVPTHSVPSIATAGISRGLLQAITSLQPPLKVKPPKSSSQILQKSEREKVSPFSNKALVKPKESLAQNAELPPSIVETEKIAHDSQTRISEVASDVTDLVPKPSDDLMKGSDEPLKVEGKMVAAPVSSKSTPASTSSSKKSGRKMFREKLKNLIQQNGEEKSVEMTKPKDPIIDSFVPSIVRAPPSPEPPKEVVTIPVERPQQPLPNVTIGKSNQGHQSSSILHRAIATLLDRQDRTDECIAISNTNCRTARFDKAGEVAKLERIKVKPMKAIMIEEFSKGVDAPNVGNGARRVEMDDDMDAGLDLHGSAPDEFVLLPRLKELRILTSYSSYPTSAILNTVIWQYCLDQKSMHIASEAYGYLDHFVFLHLGKDPKDRDQWLKLMMSSLRNCDESMIDVFSLDNNQDLHGCWLFFKNVLSRVEKETNNNLLNEDTNEEEEEESVTGPGLIFNFLVRVLQRDFEIWWKHFRKTDTGDLSHPMLYYVLGGSKNLLNHASKSVLGLFKTLLMSGSDLTNVRKLIAMVALLFSYNDSRDESAWLRGGDKLRWALAVKKILISAKLSGKNLFMELSLLQPNWLSVLVSQELVRKEEKPVISLKDLSNKFSELKVSQDAGVVASMDNLAHRMCGFLHYHTIFRNIWHHSKKDAKELDTFRCMNKLLSRGHKSTEKTIKFKSDVQVSISDLVADMNTLREFVNEGMKEEVAGSLPALLFRMTTVTQF